MQMIKYRLLKKEKQIESLPSEIYHTTPTFLTSRSYHW